MSDLTPGQFGQPGQPGQPDQPAQPAQSAQPAPSDPAGDVLTLPAGLMDDLAAAGDARVRVPREVDDAVFTAARAHFEVTETAGAGATQPASGRLRIGWWLGTAGVLAAAAAVAVVVLVGFDPQGRPGTQPGSVLAGDVDQSGQVDVVDALKLARQLEEGDPIPPMVQYNLNLDGAVNHDDVDAIAHMVVKLDPGEGPSS